MDIDKNTVSLIMLSSFFSALLFAILNKLI